MDEDIGDMIRYGYTDNLPACPVEGTDAFWLYGHGSAYICASYIQPSLAAEYGWTPVGIRLTEPDTHGRCVYMGLRYGGLYGPSAEPSGLSYDRGFVHTVSIPEGWTYPTTEWLKLLRLDITERRRLLAARLAAMHTLFPLDVMYAFPGDGAYIWAAGGHAVSWASVISGGPVYADGTEKAYWLPFINI
jgi:hypothetical protein